MSKADSNRHDRATRCKRNVIHNPDDRAPENAHVVNGLAGYDRAPVSAERRAKRSAAQSSYIENDPRWSEHRRKLAATQAARRRTLRPDQLQTIVEMRANGRTLRDIANELTVAMDVLRRGMHENGIPTTGTLSCKLSLSPDQIRAIASLRKTGRTIEDIAELIGHSRQVIAREMRALGIDTKRIRTERSVYRRSNAWQLVLDLSGGGGAWA